MLRSCQHRHFTQQFLLFLISYISKKKKKKTICIFVLRNQLAMSSETHEEKGISEEHENQA